MRITFFIIAFALAAAVHAATKPQTRVPAPGLSMTAADHSELTAGTAQLGKEIEALRRELKGAMLDLLPDVQIFHKAVDWPLRYDEFYRSNEVSIARGLLKQGMQRAQQLRAGEAPWLNATGLVVRGYVSKIDGSVQPYGLVVPGDFKRDAREHHRLDVWLHGRDEKLTELKFIADRQRSFGEFTPAGAFVLHPYGRYCNAFKFAGEVDVFEALEHVQKSYRIDSSRRALRGFSMGGAGVWHLAAHHPDVWAVAAPGAGFSETADYTGALKKDANPPAWEQKLWQLYDATDYAANFFNLPVVAYNGTEDKQRQAADMMEKAMRAEGLTLPRVWGTNVGHKYTAEGKKEVSKFVDDTVATRKDLNPVRTHFTTRTLRYDAGVGLRIEALEKHWTRGDLATEMAGDVLSISTTNVRAFMITRSFAARPKQVRVDGRDVDVVAFGSGSGIPLTWNIRARKSPDGKWVDNSLQRISPKSPGLQGPIDDAFMDSFLIVRPTGTSQHANIGVWAVAQLAKATNEWRAQFRGDARVKDDTNVTAEDIAANNLVLFGDPRSNRLLARIADKLPFKWSADEIQFAGKTFSAKEHALVLIFPNPLNPKRYVVLNSGFTFAAAGAGSNAQQTPKLPDYAVFKLDAAESVVLAGFFDEEWRP